MAGRGWGEGSVRQLPSGNWQAALPGAKRPGSTATFGTKREALDWIAKNRGRKDSPHGTVGDWLTEWLALHKAHAAASTYARDEWTVEKTIRPASLARVKLRDLNATHIKRFLADLHAAGMSGSERHRTAATLRNALNAAVPDRLGANPMAGRAVKMPSVERKEWVPFTRDQLGKLIEAADTQGAGTMLRVWADAGCRVGELLGLKWGDWDADKRELTIRRAVCPKTGNLKPPKGKRVRRVVVSATSAAALEQFAAGGSEKDAPLFPSARSRGSHQRINNFTNRVWKPIMIAAGLTGLGLTPRSIRHTMATLALAGGASLRAVAERLGHRDPSLTLRIYAHAMPSDQDRIADIMDVVISAAGSGGKPACSRPQDTNARDRSS